MTERDLVNTYFKRFYPENWQTAEYEYTTMLGGMKRLPGANNIFPEMECVDGLTLSVQAHWGAYSCPRDDFAERYSSVEVGFPSARINELMPYIDGENSDPLQTVYGYVPVELVEAIVLAHGGLKQCLCGMTEQNQIIPVPVGELVKLRRDAARLDALEKEVRESPIVLHQQYTLKGPYRGLGLISRSLREAIDQMRGAALELTKKGIEE